MILLLGEEESVDTSLQFMKASIIVPRGINNQIPNTKKKPWMRTEIITELFAD